VLEGEILKDQERADFAAFVASFAVRSPAMLRTYGELMGSTFDMQVDVLLATRERLDHTMDRYERESGETVSEALRDQIFASKDDKTGYTLEVDRQATLKVFDMANSLMKIFFNMGWQVVECEGQHLITSDNPVVWMSPPETHHPIYGDGGLLNKKVTVTLPLSTSRCLVMGWQDSHAGILRLGRQDGRVFNRVRALTAERFLYAFKKDTGIQSLGQKYKDTGFGFSVGRAGELAKVKVVRKLSRDNNTS